MNGRIYDPELGRFLSPDPVVQIPEYSQNFNRYSYALNNPLNATDPSGFSFLSKVFHAVGSWIKENWRTIVVIIIVAVVTWGVGSAFIGAGGSFTVTGAAGAAGGGLSATGLAATGAIAGTVGGGLSAALSGGNLGDVLRGAAIGSIQGAITGGLGNNVGAAFNAGNYGVAAAYAAGHGIVGGAMNMAMGGKFADGFLIAASSAAAQAIPLGNGSPAVGLIKASVVGGTVSSIGGEKFANGAFTAAFQYLVSTMAAQLGNGRTPGNIFSDEKAALYTALSTYPDDSGGLLQEFTNNYRPIDGFSAALYGSNEKGFWLAFRGTNFTSWLDWKNNVLQALGFPSEQYKMAISLGREIYAKTGGNVIFTGHSLGGGLAAAASMATGARSVTFNAAGVHRWTISGPTKQISALWLEGDILSAVQEMSPLVGAQGVRSVFSPNSSRSMFYYHSPENFLN